MRIVQAEKNKIIHIGRQGENEVVTVQFDVKGWSDLYGDGVFTVINQRPTETVGYPCTVTVSDEVVSWVVKDLDVYIEGNGRVQLIYTVNEHVAKSVQFISFIQKSIDIGDIPDPLPDWFAEVMEYISQLQIATNAQIDAELYS